MRRTAVVLSAFVVIHVTTLVILAKFGWSSSLVRSMAFPTGAAAAAIATAFSSFLAGAAIAKISGPHRDDAVLPAYVGIYLPGLVIILAYVTVCFLLGALG